MCGRYGRFSRKQRIEEILGQAIDGGEALAPRYNICPGLPDWIVRQASPGAALRFEQFHWGMLLRSSRRLINLRAETAAEKPLFRDLLRSRRCVVPIDGYYEWRATSAGKLPFWFHLRNGAPFFVAGLWSRSSYLLITTRPNELAAKVHDRMPVLLHARDVPRWLDPKIDEVGDLLRPYPADEMASRPVSRRVSDPAAEGPALIEPALDVQKSIFD